MSTEGNPWPTTSLLTLLLRICIISRYVGKNKGKHTLSQGRVARGTMVFEFNARVRGRIAAGAGAEFATIGTISAITHRSSTRTKEVCSVVGTPTNDTRCADFQMDIGMRAGPMRNGTDRSDGCELGTDYRPVREVDADGGSTVLACGMSHDPYQDSDIIVKLTSANAEELLIAEIETVPGVENAEKIAALDSIRVI